MDKLFDFNKVDWKWVGISCIIFIVAQIILRAAVGIFGVITLGLGWLLFLVITPAVYLVGGFLTGYASPGVTLIEPGIGALVTVIVGTILFSSGGGISVIFGAVIAFIFALIGAYMGEKFQAQTRNKTNRPEEE